jgi:hypothetical protein
MLSQDAQVEAGVPGEPGGRRGAAPVEIAGPEEEVLDAATEHAVAKHGHENTPELREMLRGALELAEPALA